MLNKELQGLLPDEMGPIFLDINEPLYRSKQLFQALHRDGKSLSEISTLKKTTREHLEQNFSKVSLTKSLVKVSHDGTRKYQFTTHDGHTIESVFIPHAAKLGRHSICISSQIGCAMGCTFCATAALKLVRSLTSAEIISQVYEVAKDVWAH